MAPVGGRIGMNGSATAHDAGPPRRRAEPITRERSALGRAATLAETDRTFAGFTVTGIGSVLDARIGRGSTTSPVVRPAATGLGRGPIGCQNMAT